MKSSIFNLILFLFVFNSNYVFGQGSKRYLLRVEDTSKNEYGYINLKGDTIIPIGKYPICYTERFDRLAIVSIQGKGIVGIDRNENILFKVFAFDNGPDYPSDGLFRIVKENKVGYADLKGNIVIPPRFDCAYPFKNGKAKVGNGCQLQKGAEHSWWTGGMWYYIDKKGKKVKLQ